MTIHVVDSTRRRRALCGKGYYRFNWLSQVHENEPYPGGPDGEMITPYAAITCPECLAMFCKHCRKLNACHVDGKCLFDATTFTPSEMSCSPPSSP
jgi:hypothetical protein